jgi:hypothetical protein
MALLALCLLPFIPRSSEKFLKAKLKASYSLYAEDFESKVCQMRQRAFLEGSLWIKQEVNEIIFKEAGSIFFEDLSLASNFKSKLIFLKIYEQKEGLKKLYRFKFEATYQNKDLKSKQSFTNYITLED